MIYLGVDPGLNGAAVVISDKTDTLLVKEWSTTQEAHEFLRWAVKNPTILHNDDAKAVIEKVTRPTKLTRNAGEWVGLLTALSIPFKEISPQKWQKHFGKFAKERTRRSFALWAQAEKK